MKLKPLIVHHTQNPPAFKGISKITLLAIWKANKNAWITTDIFHDWFVNHFAAERKNYCKQENVEFKVFLILDNASAHAIDFASYALM